MDMPVVKKAAVISACGQYRYLLGREWDASRPALRIIMLNPSTADADIDDPTIGRCMEFARREDRGGILVCNLLAFRSPKPAVMKAAYYAGQDIVGPLNGQYLEDMMDAREDDQPPLIMAGWGAHELARPYAAAFMKMAELRGARVHCLGTTTKSGAPRHPLYVLGTDPLVPYKIAS